MFLEDCDKMLAMHWLYEVSHFVDDDVFEQVLRLLHEFSVETDMAGAVVAASPLGFHPLQEISADFHFQLGLPLFDERRHDFVEKGFVPFVNYLGALPGLTARA